MVVGAEWRVGAEGHEFSGVPHFYLCATQENGVTCKQTPNSTLVVPSTILSKYYIVHTLSLLIGFNFYSRLKSY